MLSNLTRWVSRGTLQALKGASSRPQLVKTPHIGNQTLAAAPLPLTGGSQGVRQAQALYQERLLKIDWDDGTSSLYPFTWLRDNCQCPNCMLQSAQARSLLLSDLDVHIRMDQVQLMDNKVSITWPDQHSSEFEPEWLKKRCFSSEARQSLQEELFINEREYWDSGLQIPTANFEEVLHDDKAALAWLESLRRIGIVYLRGAPLEQGQVARLSQRIGYLRLTFYGHTWQVQDKPMANNVAYTSGKLSLHTDYPALHHPPGVQFLHCIRQADQGGESEAVDGFHVAEQLRRKDLEAFNILSSLRVDFTDSGTDYCDFSVQSKNHIIDVDSEGRVVRINYNNATRDSVLDLPLHQVQPFYSSLKTFLDLLNRPENVLTYRMEPGDLVTFDNWRLLHGRKSYLSQGQSTRHLEGAYLDWDEVMSRLRVLQKTVSGER
ncbi:gamma-butyrobetaine dioxygenase-like [Xyrauchen texanus]|uniref:gamma-butyrobetaine dioxygenase-like n=1 Tax=Xyrauchen texanus TaxID=154827 RepID=UPI0022429F3C|nr:gamma-butyrobetaine dioxygenase-like [Xyrauchen texanus]